MISEIFDFRQYDWDCLAIHFLDLFAQFKLRFKLSSILFKL